MIMAKTMIPFLNTPLATRLWQITVAVLAGACGNIILIYFLGGLMAMETLTHLLDWIVGFNTALTGYMLVDKIGIEMRFQRWICAAAGMINGLVTIMAVNRLGAVWVDGPLIEMANASILLSVSAICGALGGMLAKKYLELKNKTTPEG